ncbi:hypothetical protein DUI87_08402 [Hirundo rustica rustica]|uniref:Mitochondrial calcium uniporter regulator 1 n=1 Tax=Hirundo rustica rustica TaxID=333673 RepID=A0A3M0KSC0_HIRRU|nr:hypothetical protein DUI87_08402 [Hirundo rustica rustica]
MKIQAPSGTEKSSAKTLLHQSSLRKICEQMAHEINISERRQKQLWLPLYIMTTIPPAFIQSKVVNTQIFCIQGFTTQQSEVIVSALVKIMNTNLDMVYKDMVTKVQQEIALQQVMSHIGGVKKDMIILEKSEFSALRSENEDEITKVRADNKLNLNLEKSRVKELYSLNERKLLEMRTEIVELHAQQDRALTQTDRKIDTEVADLKTMLESHKLDNIKYLAGSVFTCLTVALGFYRLWI